MATLFSCSPKAGIVVGTHGSLPFVHLHLENAKQLTPELPLFLHDDCSPQADKLHELCRQYGADFASSPKTMGHYHGDLLAFCEGLRWAKAHGLDMMVKMSRRWVPLVDWRQELFDLALEGQYPTYSSYCAGCLFAIRTECIALHVDSWLLVCDEMYEAANTARDIGVFEEYFHGLAKRVNRAVSDRPGSYVQWPLLGLTRLLRYPGFLWHTANEPKEYAERARYLGLDYQEEDFDENRNRGHELSDEQGPA